MKMTLLLVVAALAIIAFTLPAARHAAAELAHRANDALFNYLANTGAILAMTTLAANKPRGYELGEFNELPMIAADIIYEGAAVGDNGSGLARPLVALDPFMGFAQRKADNSAGAASALKVQVRTKGLIELSVTGAASAADVGEAVYASDDDTFTLTSTNNTPIGKVHRWVSGTTCVVYFEAVSARSI
ncbi:MAG TPA: hypothetical protein VNV16_14960 [Methylibium sp.]|nr:hypothetical protein [Methylibium sp.]